ncbi:MAG TPA: Cof-type HAD-IIB family hydrolase [Thermaerobacter sp.]
MATQDMGSELRSDPLPLSNTVGRQQGRPRGVLALDMDGTLLRSDGTVSPRNRAAVARCIEAGIAVVLATGRAFVSASQYFTYWPGCPLWVIACNGAVIRQAGSGRPLRERLVPLPVARELARWAARRQLYLKAYVDDHLIVSRVTEETASFARFHGIPYTQADDLAAVLPKGPTHMVVVDEPERVPALRAEAHNLWRDRLEITSSTHDDILFCAPGVTKGTALQALARRFGVGAEKVAAIGNERNDLSMITWAGFGGAVGNAPADVREAASVVVGHHDADGVAEFIELWMEFLEREERA